MGLLVATSVLPKTKVRGSVWLIPAGSAVLYAVSVVLFFISARYRLPIVPVLILFAAAAVVWGWRERLAGDRQNATKRLRLLAGATFIIVVVLVNWPIKAPTDSISFRAELYNNVGAALAERGETEAGEGYVRRALRIDDRYAGGYSRLGLILAQRGAVAEAEACFRRSLELDREASEVYWYLGNALFVQGRVTEAMDAINKSLAIDPFSPEARALLADVLLATGRTEEAIEQYRQALVLPPRRGELLFDLAGALARGEHYAEAIDCYREGLGEVGPRRQALHNFAWLLITCPQAELRDCGEAVELAETLVRMTAGRDPMALETLGMAYAACGRVADAEQALTRAIQLAVAVGDDALVAALRSTLTQIEAGAPPADSP